MEFDLDFSKKGQEEFYNFIELKRKEINELPDVLGLKKVASDKLETVHKLYNLRLIKYLNQVMEYKRNPSVNKEPLSKLNSNKNFGLGYLSRN